MAGLVRQVVSGQYRNDLEMFSENNTYVNRVAIVFGWRGAPMVRAALIGVCKSPMFNTPNCSNC